MQGSVKSLGEEEGEGAESKREGRKDRGGKKDARDELTDGEKDGIRDRETEREGGGGR